MPGACDILNGSVIFNLNGKFISLRSKSTFLLFSVFNQSAHKRSIVIKGH